VDKLLDGAVLNLRDALLRHELLEDHLVHAQRRRQHAGADVGHAEALEQPLDRPVLAEGPVEHREDDVDAGQARAQGHRHRLAVPSPHAVAPNVDLGHRVAGRAQPVGHRGARGQ
jgi:hypothetical protein